VWSFAEQSARGHRIDTGLDRPLGPAGCHKHRADGKGVVMALRLIWEQIWEQIGGELVGG
jgi:hypothetical protein